MFEFPLTSAEEYWIGYMRADGCITRNERRAWNSAKSPLKMCKFILFGQKHKEPVQAFADFIGATNKVRYTEAMTTFGLSTVYSIASKKAAWELDALGCKTELDLRLYQSKHFWRGLLDGDGSIGMQKNSNKLYPVICWSGSEYDMQQLSLWLINLMGCKTFKVGATRRITFRVGTNGAKAAWLAKYLYEGEYAKLDYKSEAAKICMEWTSNHRNSWKYQALASTSLEPTPST